MKIYLVIHKADIETHNPLCCFRKKEDAEDYIKKLVVGEKVIISDDDYDYVLLPDGEKYYIYDYTDVRNQCEIEELSLF